MGQLLTLQAKKIITKHKNPFLSSRELDLNLQREGFAGWRYHPRIPFLQSSSIYVPCSLRLYGNSREQNRQNSLTWGANSPMSLYLLLVSASFFHAQRSWGYRAELGRPTHDPLRPNRTYKTLPFRTKYRDQSAGQRMNFPQGQTQAGSRGPTPGVPLVWVSLQLSHWL